MTKKSHPSGRHSLRPSSQPDNSSNKFSRKKARAKIKSKYPATRASILGLASTLDIARIVSHREVWVLVVITALQHAVAPFVALVVNLNSITFEAAIPSGARGGPNAVRRTGSSRARAVRALLMRSRPWLQRPNCDCKYIPGPSAKAFVTSAIVLMSASTHASKARVRFNPIARCASELGGDVTPHSGYIVIHFRHAL